MRAWNYRSGGNREKALFSDNKIHALQEPPAPLRDCLLGQGDGLTVAAGNTGSKTLDKRVQLSIGIVFCFGEIR
jgi:hypothetical protein